MTSTLPAHSAPAWTSAFTGVNPGKHGVFDFFKWDGFERKLTHSGDNKAKYVWDIVGEYEKRSIVVNVPMTFPPHALNGIMISGIPAPSESGTFTYPAELSRMISESGYKIDPKHTNLEQDYESLLGAELIRSQVMIDLLKKQKWDLGIIVFTALDRIQHRFWNQTNNLGIANKISEAYRKIDSLVQKIIEACPSQTNILVMSDHGFSGCKAVLYVNEWLRQKSLLRSNTTPSKRILRSMGVTREGLKRKTPKSIARRFPKTISRAVPTKNQAREDINWKYTKAWLSSPGGQGIIINPQFSSTVDCKEFREKLITDLQNIRWRDGTEVLRAVLPRTEVYWGPYGVLAPDLALVLNDGWRVSESMGGTSMEASHEGWHQRDGIFIGMGSFQRSKDLEKRAHIWDIAPTILDLLDIRVEKDMDGKSLVKS